MSIKIDGTGNITFNDNSVQNTAFSPEMTMFRNLVMNPLHYVNQRNSTAVSTATNGFISDRWRLGTSHTSTSLELQSDAAASPSLYTDHYMRLRPNAAIATPTTTQYSMIVQAIEGHLMRRLGWGTAAAKPVTLSFRASAQTAGNMTVSLRNNPANRSYLIVVPLTTTPQTFTYTIPGDTTGTWDKGSGWGMELAFVNHSGPTYVSSTATAWQAGNFLAHTSQTNFQAVVSRDIRIADVQLEAGTVATPLQFLDAPEELARCERYYQTCSTDATNLSLGRYSNNFGFSISIYPCFTFRKHMRAVPTLTGLFDVSDGASTQIGPYVLEPSNTSFTLSFVIGASAFLDMHSWQASADL